MLDGKNIEDEVKIACKMKERRMRSKMQVRSVLDHANVQMYVE